MEQVSSAGARPRLLSDSARAGPPTYPRVHPGDRMSSVPFQGKPFNITVIQVYAPTSNAKEAERSYGDLLDLLELTPPKDVLFMIGD